MTASTRTTRPRSPLGLTLTAAREKAGLTQRAAAQTIGILPVTLCFIEHGQTGNGDEYEPTLNMLRRMAAAYKTTASKLVEDSP